MFSKWGQVLDAQLACQQFWSDDFYVEKMLEIWRAEGKQSTTNLEVTAILAREMMDGFEPVFISEDIVDLATHAAQSFEMETHRVEDFFTPWGFAVLEKPFISKRDADNLVAEIRYIWWLWSQPTPEDPPMGVVVMSGGAYEEGKRNSELDNAHHTFRWIPQVIYRMDEESLPTPEHEYDGHPVIFLQALMRLAQQPLAEHTEAAADRPTRRRVQRAGGSVRPITTITLRRPKGASTGAASSREYTHRWMVNGFWRNQFYPSLGTHRQIYINSFVKGPKDKPLVLKHRRFDFRR